MAGRTDAPPTIKTEPAESPPQGGDGGAEDAYASLAAKYLEPWHLEFIRRAKDVIAYRLPYRVSLDIERYIADWTKILVADLRLDYHICSLAQKLIERLEKEMPYFTFSHEVGKIYGGTDGEESNRCVWISFVEHRRRD